MMLFFFFGKCVNTLKHYANKLNIPKKKSLIVQNIKNVIRFLISANCDKINLNYFNT